MFAHDKARRNAARPTAAKAQRTLIADIAVAGAELSEEQLQFVSGARRSDNSSYTEWVPELGGGKDRDKDF